MSLALFLRSYDHTRTGSIPDSLSSLTALQYLYLPHNRLSGEMMLYRGLLWVGRMSMVCRGWM